MSKQLGRRRRIVRAVAPAVGLLAAGLLVWQGSYAAFSATTSATGNTWTTGNLVLENNGGGTYATTTSANFGGTNLKPGSTSSVCLTVRSGGNVAGDLRMYVSKLTNTDALASKIDITVQAASTTTDVSKCSDFPTSGASNLYNTTLDALPVDYAGATASNVAVASGSVLEAYKITWTLDSSTDKTFMNKSASADLTWEIQ
jgi:hypothetical protein